MQKTIVIFSGGAQVAYLGTRRFERIGLYDGEKLVFISCSNLISLKRVDLIIKGLAALPEDCKVEWHMFGDGDQRAYQFS